jgi:crotonobetainyl-CoA:carnitine CoA-transferase CaiB-like acyl-CoA transferase
MSNKEWQGFCRAMKRVDLLEDERFKTPAGRDTYVNERLAAIQQCLLGRSTAENIALLEGQDVPCAPALTRAEVVDHPQVRAMATLYESEHPVAGRLRQARNPARFEGETLAPARGAPQLGEHCHEILSWLGYDAAKIQQLAEARVVGFETDRAAVPQAAE